VYGKNVSVPFREDADLVLGPTTSARWCYACSKAINEFLALAYSKEHRLQVVIGRLFNTVGPRQTAHYGMVLPTFVSQARCGAPLTVFGSGKQTRCFAYVGEVVEAIIRLIECDRAFGEVVNIGNDEETTIEALACRVKETFHSPSSLRFIAYDQAYEPGFEDVMRRRPCLEKLLRLTGYRPSMPLNEIIEKIAAYSDTERADPTPRGAVLSSQRQC
jgi:UDP-glucose 4-epimerase